MAQNTKMQSDELLELHEAVEYVHLFDARVGHALRLMLKHVAHAHGLDLADEQEKVQKQADEQANAEQDAMDKENARIEQERADVRKNIDPQKEAIAVPVDSLPSQQQEKGASK